MCTDNPSSSLWPLIYHQSLRWSWSSCFARLAGLLALAGAFLYVMRTDGPLYRTLTTNYTPPAARQQAAEEERRERIAESQRTAASAWESERARWRAQQQKPHPRNSPATQAAPPSTSTLSSSALLDGGAPANPGR